MIFFVTLCYQNNIIYSGIPFLCALLHEAGHIFAMKITGERVRSIKILPFGADIEREGKLLPFGSDLFVNSAGIVTNALLALLCGAFPKNEITSLIFTSNILLIMLNILPIKSLDGGQITERVLITRLDISKCDTIMNILSFSGIFLLGSIAIWILFNTGYNFTLLFMCIYLFSAIFLKDNK